MTEEQDKAFSGWAPPQLTKGLNAKENARKNEMKRNIPQLQTNRESKYRKHASRPPHGIKTDEKLATNRKRKFDTRFKEASNIKCESRQKPRHGSTDLLSLSWQNSYPIIPVESENALLPVLLPWGQTERGMIKTQPPFRVQKIRKACRLHGMQLEQALSLRRHHMKLLNPQAKSMTCLGLGNNNDIRGAAQLFENATYGYLKECGIPFLTEEDQKRRFYEKQKPGVNMPPTPDFMLTNPINLISVQAVNKDSTGTEFRQINWIEAKMFYGASTIPDGTNNAVGAILRTAKKYIENYGSGAFLFSYGCGSQLRGQLSDLGIAVLDSHPLNLEKVEEHQRRWCADKNGAILP